MNAHVKAVTDATFQSDVLSSSKPVLVDFWAEWCGPCRVLGPVVDEVAESHHETVGFVKVNVDECPETAAQFGIMSIPTLMLFKDGQVVATRMGAMPKSQLVAFIESHS